MSRWKMSREHDQERRILIYLWRLDTGFDGAGRTCAAPRSSARTGSRLDARRLDAGRGDEDLIDIRKDLRSGKVEHAQRGRVEGRAHGTGSRGLTKAADINPYQGFRIRLR